MKKNDTGNPRTVTAQCCSQSNVLHCKGPKSKIPSAAAANYELASGIDVQDASSPSMVVVGCATKCEWNKI